MSETKQQFWFKPKRHGYGAVPNTWQGVLVTTAFALLVPLISVPWILSLSDEHRFIGMAVWALALLFSVWKFTEFAKRKTDGEWLWRWNGKPYRELMAEKAKELEE
ncbi:MAG: hypothetical protein K0U74_04820 [Alphaproteobacteria bacterium]|nr:hypothetical protein [Alphaproteobacteria bacterium]